MSDITSRCPVCESRGTHETFGHAHVDVNGKVYDYHRCQQCGLLYQHPMPSDEEISSFYPEDYAVYQEPTRTRFNAAEQKTLRKLGYPSNGAGVRDRLRRARALPDVIPYIPGGRALDIGCACGEYLLRLESIGWQCQGVEFSPHAVAVARRHGLNVFLGGLMDAQFEPDSFDFVTAHHYIEHVPNPDEIMAELVRVTKPGGSILIRTPNNGALGRRWFGEYWFPNGIPEHVLLFSDSSLQALAGRHALRLQRRYTPIEFKFILKSRALKMGNFTNNTRYSKLSKWLARLYIPLAKLSGQGDELFYIFTKPTL